MDRGFPKTFSIVNLGCKVNRVEADALQAALMQHGSIPVEEELADLIIVNTCTVTAEADRKARKACRHALYVNPLADVVVTGCATAIDPMAFTSIDSRLRIIDRADLAIALQAGVSDALRVGEGFRTRVNIKIQDGCDHACTYCIVHVARGKARSLPAPEVIAEARGYFDAGVKEVVLAGIDIGSYDSDGMRIAELAKRLIDEADHSCAPGCVPARIRISSIEPMNVDEALIGLLAESEGRLCRHLHLPLQSGSTRVLREMNRPYTAERYIELVSQLRELVPSLALSTDIIVGFPGETDEDFVQTCELARAAGFSRIHVFPYSMRKGTPAAIRDDQIEPAVRHARARQLRHIAVELAGKDIESRHGTTELALVEGPTALTESYHEVAAPADAAKGSLVPVEL